MNDFEIAFSFVVLALAAANCLLPLMMLDSIRQRDRLARECVNSWREAERGWEEARAKIARLPTPSTPQCSPKHKNPDESGSSAATKWATS